MSMACNDGLPGAFSVFRPILRAGVRGCMRAQALELGRLIWRVGQMFVLRLALDFVFSANAW